MNVNERNKQIKRALLKSYDAKNVSVKGDRGTAYGWVKVKVSLNRPEGCQCKFETKTATWAKVPYEYTYRVNHNINDARSTYYCEKCINVLKENKEKVDKIVYTCGAEFYHFYADDGYNTKHAEVLIDVEVK